MYAYHILHYTCTKYMTFLYSIHCALCSHVYYVYVIQEQSLQLVYMSLMHLADLNLILLSNKSGIRHVSSASDVTPHTGFTLVPSPIRIQTLFKLSSNSMYTTILPPLLEASATASTAATVSNMTSSILGKRNRDINSDTTYFYHHYTTTTTSNTTAINNTTTTNPIHTSNSSNDTAAAASSSTWKKFLKKYQAETSFSITDRNPNNNKNRVSSTITISQRIRDYVLDPSIPIVTTVLHNTH